MKAIHSFIGAAAALTLLAGQPASAADIVYNGGFELPGVPAGSSLHVNPGNTVGGWKVLGGTGSYYLDGAYSGGGTSWPGVYEGTDYLYLNDGGIDGVSISQSVMLDAGQTYRLSFAMSSVVVASGTVARQPAVTAQVGAATASFAGVAGNAWQTFAFDFTPAAAGATTLTFTSNAALTDGRFAVVMLDGIAVQAVPEPATVALMLFGLAALTAAKRRPG